MSENIEKFLIKHFVKANTRKEADRLLERLANYTALFEDWELGEDESLMERTKANLAAKDFEKIYSKYDRKPLFINTYQNMRQAIDDWGNYLHTISDVIILKKFLRDTDYKFGTESHKNLIQAYNLNIKPRELELREIENRIIEELGEDSLLGNYRKGLDKRQGTEDIDEFMDWERNSYLKSKI